MSKYGHNLINSCDQLNITQGHLHNLYTQNWWTEWHTFSLLGIDTTTNIYQNGWNICLVMAYYINKTKLSDFGFMISTVLSPSWEYLPYPLGFLLSNNPNSWLFEWKYHCYRTAMLHICTYFELCAHDFFFDK